MNSSIFQDNPCDDSDSIPDTHSDSIPYAGEYWSDDGYDDGYDDDWFDPPGAPDSSETDDGCDLSGIKFPFNPVRWMRR
jgi:hypothetical protein